MEYALFAVTNEIIEKNIDKTHALDGLPPAWREGRKPPLSFDRIYFGQEFCERLAPTLDEMNKAFVFAKKKGADFTLVTPFVTEEGLEKWAQMAKEYLELYPGGEIVFNDFGIFDEIMGHHPRATPILGRLLTKQKRGPRIQRLRGQVPETMMEHFRRFNADAPHLSTFYKSLGIKRIELDNTLQGIARDDDFRASLYYPYYYVSTSRMCLVNQCDDREEPMRAIFPCKRECRQVRFKITHSEIPAQITLAGNTQFGINKNLPPQPGEIYVDRLVYEPEPPV